MSELYILESRGFGVTADFKMMHFDLVVLETGEHHYFFIVACFPSLERFHFCLDAVKGTEVKSMWHKIMFLDLAMVPVLFFVYF